MGESTKESILRKISDRSISWKESKEGGKMIRLVVHGRVFLKQIQELPRIPWLLISFV